MPGVHPDRFQKGVSVYFAFGECDGRRPVWGEPNQPRYHVHAIDLASGDILKVTDGRQDDFDPCPLPDGARRRAPPLGTLVVFLNQARAAWTPFRTGNRRPQPVVSAQMAVRRPKGY
jgi:hypothetical protein